MKLKIAGSKFWFLIVFLFLLLRLPSLFEPYWYGDEAIYLVLGQAIRKGLILYRDIHDNKPPSLYYLAAISQTVFGFRLILLFWMALTSFVFYKFCQKFSSPLISKISLILFIFLTSLPFIEGNIANAEIFMLLPTIYAFYILNPKKYQSVFMSGLCLGIAFTIKMPSLLEFFCLAFFLFGLFVSKKDIKSLKHLILNVFILTAGFILPTIIYALYFLRAGALPQFLHAAIFQNFPYLTSWQTNSHQGFSHPSGLIIRAFLLLIFFIIYLTLLIKNKINPNHFLVLSWLSATLFASLLSQRPYPHYLIQLIPPFCLGLILLFKRSKQFSFWFIFSLIIVVFSIHKFNFYFYKNTSYYQAFYFNLLNKNNFHDYFGNQVNQSRKIISYLNAYNLLDRSVFVWGDAPYIYAKLNILPPDIYTVAYHIVDFQSHQNTITNLLKYSPQFIVYYQMDNRPFPKLDHIISRYYYLDNLVDNISIYQKR